MAASNTSSPTSRKLALVIGSDNYTRPYNRLKQCLNNANDLGDLLKTIDFHVTSYVDGDTSMMERIKIFSELIHDGDLILFYFSGHCYQVHGKNFLIPVNDDKIEIDLDIPIMGIDIERVLERLVSNNPSSVTIVILDCCTSYLLENSTRTNSNIDRGDFREIHPPDGVFIQFSGVNNQGVIPATGTDRNTLFAKHLLKNVTRKNANLTEIFGRIAENVYRESNQKQKPLSMTGLHQYRQTYLNQVPIVIKPRRNLQLERKIEEISYRSPLNLIKLQLNDADMETIVTQAVIKKQCTWLRIEKNTITSVGASILANALQKKNSLEGLGLFGNQLSDAGVQSLSIALSSTRNTVKSLGIGENRMTDLSVHYLIEMLKTNQTITQLYLQKNAITDQGVQLLTDAIVTHRSSIEDLDLSGNRLLTDTSVDSLRNLIQHAVSLQRLWLNDCNLSSNGKQQLASDLCQLK